MTEDFLIELDPTVREVEDINSDEWFINNGYDVIFIPFSKKIDAINFIEKYFNNNWDIISGEEILSFPGPIYYNYYDIDMSDIKITNNHFVVKTNKNKFEIQGTLTEYDNYIEITTKEGEVWRFYNNNIVFIKKNTSKPIKKRYYEYISK